MPFQLLMKRYVFIRLLLPFMLGILIFHLSPGISTSWLAIAIILGLIALLLSSKKQAPVSGLIISLVLIGTGNLSSQLHYQLSHTNHFSTINHGNSHLVICLTEKPLIGSNNIKAKANVKAIGLLGDKVEANGKVQLYFTLDDKLAKGLQQGDLIIVENKTSPINPPQNPGEFNYQAYMATQNIYHQAYLYPQNWRLTDQNQIGFAEKNLNNLRIHLQTVFETHLTDSVAQSIAKAIILGDKTSLNQLTKDTFSQSGTMHLLAVSGLHVGIIVLLLSFLFNKVFSGRPYLAALAIITGIWLFVLLTGVPPSALRAGVMFSFIIVGQNLNRKVDVLNSLAAAAFFMLLFNPFLLFTVGFQLSFIAVAGIVLIYPLIYKKLYVKNKIANWFWQLTAVSIAAQIATAPLSAFYFHQFPNFFILSNLIALPLAFPILTLGISTSATAIVWPAAAGVLGVVLNWLIKSLTVSLDFINSFTFALTDNLFPTLPELILVYSILGLTLLFIRYKTFSYLSIGLALTLLLITLNTVKRYNQYNQEALIVYSANKASAIDLAHGKSSVTLIDTMQFIEKPYFEQTLKSAHGFYGIERSSFVSKGSSFQHDKTHIADNYLQFGDKRIVVINEFSRKNRPKEKLKTDYLIITNNADVSIERLSEVYTFNKIIFDRSNSEKRAARWTYECKQLDLNYHNLWESNAFIATLESS